MLCNGCLITTVWEVCILKRGRALNQIIFQSGKAKSFVDMALLKLYFFLLILVLRQGKI